jgi:hypothetical protein
MATLALDKQSTLNIIILDILAISAIYFMPTITHLLSFPIYLIEPMRIALVLAMMHTRKENAYILALTLPAFSFLISGHPVAPKMIIITLELLVNVWLFFTFSKMIKNEALTMLAAVLLSKMFYYFVKLGLIGLGFLSMDLISTPIWIQFVVAFVLSAYVFIMGFIRKQS